MFIVALVIIAKIRKKLNAHHQMNGYRWYVHTHRHTQMEYYSAIRKKKVLLFTAPWMNSEGIILSEISQREKDKYGILSLVCGI